MFGKLFSREAQRTIEANSLMAHAVVEGLEDRRLLSASHLLAASAATLRHSNSTQAASLQPIQFSAAPAVVQAGLQAIAPSGTTIDATQNVYVRTLNSTSSIYSVKLSGSNSSSGTRLSVDENGLPAGNERITFGQLQNGPANDAAIATALQGLAPSGVTIGGTQNVVVRTGRDGTTNFSVSVSNSNGTVTKITVDSTGAVVSSGNGHMPAAANTILFSAATSAVRNGLQAIAPSGATIDPSTTVTLQKLNATTTLYSVKLAGVISHDERITVDQNGLPAGEEVVLFSQLQAGSSNDQGIASGLANLAPSGVTIAGTQDVRVHTFNGATTYSVTLISNGTSTTISVDSSGAAVTASTPSATTTTFGAAPAAVQAGLQAIAPSGTTIDSSQTVYVLTLGANTSYYSLNLNTDTSIWGFGRGWGDRITVDAAGLPAGNQQITFGQLENGPANDKAIAAAIQALAPSGTTLAATQAVLVRTLDGTSTYTVDLTNTNGTTSEITVDKTGAAVSSPAGGGGDHFGFGDGGGGFGHRGPGGGFGGHGFGHR